MSVSLAGILCFKKVALQPSHCLQFVGFFIFFSAFLGCGSFLGGVRSAMQIFLLVVGRHLFPRRQGVLSQQWGCGWWY